LLIRYPSSLFINFSNEFKKTQKMTLLRNSKDENALTWDTEIGIKESIVNNLNLNKIFKDKA